MNLPFFAKKRIALQGGGQHPGSLVNITGICNDVNFSIFFITINN